MNILLFDTLDRDNFYPLTLTRAIADMRMGIFTIKERWEKVTSLKAFILTEPYLQEKYEAVFPGEYLLIDARVMVTTEVMEAVLILEKGQAYIDQLGLIAGRLTLIDIPSFSTNFETLFNEKIRTSTSVKRLEYSCNIFQWNEEVLRFDYEIITEGGTSSDVIKTSHLINPTQIFIEEGAEVHYSMLNASTGPIYIGKNATVLEGCLIRGPFALGEGATLKMGSKVYGATTLGPGCVGGGEIKNSVMMGYSNKAHDGYLGDSVIGEWCNFGAGTSNSNIKNTAGDVKVWNYLQKDYMMVGMKCGLVMGDYSRTAINTSINTGTMIGVCCNVFGEGLTPKVVSNFTWGTKELTRYELYKGLKDVENWKKMKNKIFTEEERNVLIYIFENYND